MKNSRGQGWAPHYFLKADSAVSNGFRKKGLDTKTLVSIRVLSEVTARHKGSFADSETPLKLSASVSIFWLFIRVLQDHRLILCPLCLIGN